MISLPVITQETTARSTNSISIRRPPRIALEVFQKPTSSRGSGIPMRPRFGTIVQNG